ncbi:MAG: PD-(D/E)XK nuclease family protein, partial [Candidatus Thermoplasmatota archaeon]|nr:PD-(D/E)XK nuclease family protein [Candidatus Thermoplasmatota archaeon]
RMLTGFTRNEWFDWLGEESPTPLAGRIGRMIAEERTLSGAIPIAIEWEALSFDEDGIEISLPEEISSHGHGELPSLRLRGEIDRVDLVPFDSEMTIFEDENGSQTVAPIRLDGEDWRPRRQIIIRDIKTSEGKPIKRHRLGLLEELQLALYARAWEIAHPGDLVIAAGISVIGHNTNHFLEVSGHINEESSSLELGDRSHPQTSRMHRFPDEEPEQASDSFRAWLAQRLTTALATAAGAANGRVHPTPSEDACKFCPVTSVCDVRVRGDNL